MCCGRRGSSALALDERGLYFDPSGPSDLEHLLLTAIFEPEGLQRARDVREFIVRHGITRYNHEPRAKAAPMRGSSINRIPT
nr:hypothetical protein [Chlorobaculum sp. 24CR]